MYWFILIITSAWAISLSWCGNLRSMPPVWISNVWPNIQEAITEHSICQPGLPFPQEESHHGSPFFDFFQRAKSLGERFSLTALVVRSPKMLFYILFTFFKL